jgi:hypothetical protein
MQRSEIHNYLIVVVVEEKKENIPRVFLSDDQNYEHNFFTEFCDVMKYGV